MKAVCIININKYDTILDLTIGKSYVVSCADQIFRNQNYMDYYNFIDDRGENCIGKKDWFVDIIKYREQKLKRILNDI